MGKGLGATEDIDKGELIAYVTRDMIITEAEAKTSKYWLRLKNKGVLDQIKNGGDELPWVLYLLENRRAPGSYWRDFLALKPRGREMNIFPTMYSSEDIRWLAGSKVQK